MKLEKLVEDELRTATGDDGMPETADVAWRGSLDIVTQTEIYGWASLAGEPVDAYVSVNDNFTARTRSTNYRSDLREVGVSAHAGFNVALATPLAEGDVVHVTFEDGTPLHHSPIVWHPPVYTPSAAGHLDVVTTSEIVGWAALDGEAADIEIHVNGEFLTTIRGGCRREDLAPHRISPEAGFAFSFPASLNVGDRVRVSFPDGRVLGEREAGALHAAGHLDAVTVDRIYGWAQLDGAPDEVSIYVNDSLVGTIRGGHFRQDVADGGHDGHAGFAMTLEHAVKEGDKVGASFSDGRPLQGSPQIYRPVSAFTILPRCGDERPLFFIHVPKTAGTSLRRLIDRHAPDRLALYNGELGNFELIKQLRSARLPKLVMGHFPFGTHNYLDVPPNYTCVLRDPVERVVSLYRYARTLPGEAFWPFKNYELKPLVERGITEQTNNHMCRLCAGVTTPPGVTINERWLLDYALHNITHYFAFVGSITNLNAYVRRLCDKMKWFDIPLTFENVTKGAKHDIDASTLECVRAYNALDAELLRLMEARWG